MNNEIKEILNKLQYGFCSQLTYEKLLDYITNLQQENEELKQENERLKELDENYPIEEELAEAYKREENYKSRKEKAVEYINCNKQKTICAYGDNEDDDFEICLWEEDIDNLLNILNGKE